MIDLVGKAHHGLGSSPSLAALAKYLLDEKEDYHWGLVITGCFVFTISLLLDETDESS